MPPLSSLMHYVICLGLAQPHRLDSFHWFIAVALRVERSEVQHLPLCVPSRVLVPLPVVLLGKTAGHKVGR
jgi:hypothetical protein